jgi:hypothetical protein
MVLSIEQIAQIGYEAQRASGRSVYQKEWHEIPVSHHYFIAAARDFIEYRKLVPDPFHEIFAPVVRSLGDMTRSTRKSINDGAADAAYHTYQMVRHTALGVARTAKEYGLSAEVAGAVFQEKTEKAIERLKDRFGAINAEVETWA